MYTHKNDLTGISYSNPQNLSLLSLKLIYFGKQWIEHTLWRSEIK